MMVSISIDKIWIFVLVSMLNWSLDDAEFDGGNAGEFGCDFSNPSYGFHLENIFDTYYGIHRAPLELPDKESVFSLVNVTNEILANVLRDNLHNTLYSFVEYHLRYNSTLNRTQEYFNEFFDDYEVPFRNIDESYSHAILVLHELGQMHNHVLPHVYLSTVWTNICQDDMILVQGLDEVPPFFIHDHVVAVLRFKLGDNSGYIIMNPVQGMAQAVIINDYGASYVTSASAMSYPEDVPGVYTTFDSFSNYVHEDVNKYVIVRRLDRYPDLVYVEKPICSFIETVTKPQLLKPTRFILRRDETGRGVARIDFNFGTSLLDAVIVFTLYTEELPEDSEKFEFYMRYIPTVTLDYNDLVQTVIAYLGFDTQTFNGILTRVYNIYFDRTFFDFAAAKRQMFEDERETIKNSYANGGQGTALRRTRVRRNRGTGGASSSRRRD